MVQFMKINGIAFVIKVSVIIRDKLLGEFMYKIILKSLLIVSFSCVGLLAKSKYKLINANGQTLGIIESDSVRNLSSEERNEYQHKYPNQHVFFSKKNSPTFKWKQVKREFHLNSDNTQYFEVRKMETFKVCADSNIDKILWRFSEPFEIDNNCLISEAPDLTRSILLDVEYVEDGVKRNDSHWVLVDQKFINFKNKKVTLYSKQKRDNEGKGFYFTFNPNNDDPNVFVSLNKEIIVDITELTAGDHYQLAIFEKKRTNNSGKLRKPSEKYWNKPSSSVYYKKANQRSRLDGLSPVFLDQASINTLTNKNHLIRFNDSLYIDTCANGYRFPFMAEWAELVGGGTSSDFYWGNSTDSNFISQYENLGVTPNEVAQKKSNTYGLYDTFGNGKEQVLAQQFIYSEESPYLRMDTNEDYKVFNEISKEKLRFSDKIMLLRSPIWNLRAITTGRFVRQVPAESCNEF